MSKVAKTTIGLMIVTMLSKVLGFGRELALTYVYGANAISDVYITSLSIPSILFSTIASALSTTFIPLFLRIDKSKGRNKSLLFANNVFNIVIVLTILMAIFGFIFVQPLVKLFAMSFEGEKLSLAVDFTRIMIFGIVFIGLSNLMSAWLQISGNFTIPGMISFPYNVLVIGGILLSVVGDVRIMAIGTLIGMASQFLFQLPYAIRKGYKYQLYINIRDKDIKKMIFLIMPVFLGIAVNQLNAIIDRSLASTLGDGVITVLNSASRLNSFVMGIFIGTISSVIYPMLSKLSNEDSKNEFIKVITHSVNTVILLIIPISVVAIILAEPVVRIVFERGAFDSNATNMTAIALACYSIGMIGFALREILNKVFYSIQDTKTPMINGSIAMVMNIILNIIIIKFLGYAGIALATSISSLICIVLLFNSLNKKIGYFGQDKIRNTMIKSLISAGIMGVITNISYKYLSSILESGFTKGVIPLFGSIGIGGGVYGLLLIVLKVEEVKIIIDMLKKRSKYKSCDIGV